MNTSTFFTSSLLRTPFLGVWSLNGILRDRKVGPLKPDIPEPFAPPLQLADGNNDLYSAGAVIRRGPGTGVSIETVLGYRILLPDPHPITTAPGRVRTAGDIAVGDRIYLKACTRDSNVVFNMRGYRLEPGLQLLIGILFARGRRAPNNGFHSAVGIPARLFTSQLRRFLERHSARILSSNRASGEHYSVTITDPQLNNMMDIILDTSTETNALSTMLLILPRRDLTGILEPLIHLTVNETIMTAPDPLCGAVAASLLLRWGIITRRERPGALNLFRSAAELTALLAHQTIANPQRTHAARNPALADRLSTDGVFADRVASVTRLRGELFHLDGGLPQDCSFSAWLP